MSEINWMDLNEFVDKGFLQEANRQFFHPLGLALAVSYKGGKAISLIGIWDYRNDPDGIRFAESDLPGADKTEAVDILYREKARARRERFGWIIQPIVENAT